MTKSAENLIPELPTLDQVEIWQDVPREHFDQADKWTHREALKQRFNLSERGFFRWLETLKSQGIARTLPTRTGRRMNLFYLPDIDRMLSAQAAQVVQNNKRGRKPKVLAGIINNAGENTGEKTSTYGAKFLGSYSSAEANYLTNTIAELQKENRALRMQQQILSNAIVRIESMLSQLAVQQAALSAQLQVLTIDNRATTNSNTNEKPSTNQLQINEMIITTLNKLSEQIQQLPDRLKREELNHEGHEVKN